MKRDPHFEMNSIIFLSVFDLYYKICILSDYLLHYQVLDLKVQNLEFHFQMKL